MFTLDGVVPWGQSFDEYLRMFSLSERDLELKILGCGDGPASFNAEASRRGWRVVSCDPIYQWSASDIRSRVAETYRQIMEQTRQNAEEFVWTSIPSVEELGRRRMAAMETFLDDYEAGKVEGRYVNGLPVLPFVDDAFDLAMCSHLLFLYTMQLGEASTGRLSASCAAWRAKCAFFPCWRWAASDPHTSRRSPPPLVPRGTKRSSKLFRTSFGGAGTR